MQRWYFKALIFVLHRSIIKPTLVLSVWSRMHKVSFLSAFMWNGLEGGNQIPNVMQLGIVP